MTNRTRLTMILAGIFFVVSMFSGFLASITQTGFGLWLAITSLVSGIGCVILTVITVDTILDL